MAQKINKLYEDAVASGLLPGVSVIAGDKDGNVLYSKSLGKASLKDSRDDAFTPSTVCALASMSKLMTSVAVLQCVEQGKLDLDQDVRPMLPEMGKYGIITAFDDDRNEATFKPDATPITLRMLLSHTSGHEYDWFNPLLGKWRASRGEVPWSGPTVEHKSALPLVFPPGTDFAYGAGHDWASKVVEVATGTNLEAFMQTHIWTPLGIQDDVSFYPKTKPTMRDRMADISTLSEQGEPPAVDAPTFDILFGGTDCLGGGGVFASAEAYYAFISAVFRRDPKLLTPASYDELFRPQLNEAAEQAFNDYFARSPMHTQFLALGIPHTVRKTWSFAGMVCLDAQEGRFKKGTTFWAGVPSVKWFMDHEAGICGTALCQILPPMHPAVIALHEEFQRGVYEMVESK
ncbi:beta-lactamase/transpeptidase-like protein [Chaetomidium leptoderma]|uniref:Beta-lactamase/transpeptidase-like protein n=1 Tax=Chaetomidium leptoderma TaxID=669021 RepID=A0AAN6VTU0_9PEZI|nr:beta-lactamase/transpeptidase-like protein [Chaetomidium leptoderma]